MPKSDLDQGSHSNEHSRSHEQGNRMEEPAQKLSTQERITLIRPEDADGDTKVLFEAVDAMLGRVPASYQAMAHSPHVAKMLVPFNAVLQREGAGSVLETKIKEMVVIKTSHLNGCAY